MNKQLQWQGTIPFNTEYNDIYFSKEDGLAESYHVFLRGNQLEQRWRRLPENSVFTIFEAGFGSGLNFLACLNLWRKIAPTAHLNYISCDKMPFTTEQLQQAHQTFSEQLTDEITTFADKIDAVHEGVNVYQIEAQVQLTLLYCDITNWREYTPDNIALDAVFMDGFSPARNPAMWSQNLCDSLHELCKPGATLSTFSVAGVIKQHLKQAGFSINKVPGYGTKREMLTALKTDSAS